jgi:pimeloyl-ACP methyl ester carboxylesterase
MEQGETVTLPDGRKLGYLIVGKGKPVFYFHGFPGSRLDLHYQKATGNMDLQMIGVDRPGFGLSSYLPNRKVSDFASDVRFLADQLGIDKFALVGVSGGGHYVITCAALLKKRVTRAVVVSGAYCPVDTVGMMRTNKWGFRLVPLPILGEWLEKQQRKVLLTMAEDPDAFMASEQGKKMLKEMPEDQLRLLQNPELRDVFCRTLVESYRQGDGSLKAYAQEIKLMKKPWEVDLSEIPSGLVHIWHGTADTNVPVSNAYKNAKAIPGAHLEIFEGGGHTFLFDNLKLFGKLFEILVS